MGRGYLTGVGARTAYMREVKAKLDRFNPVAFKAVLRFSPFILFRWMRPMQNTSVGVFLRCVQFEIKQTDCTGVPS
jgi:hypothetical protein